MPEENIELEGILANFDNQFSDKTYHIGWGISDKNDSNKIKTFLQSTYLLGKEAGKMEAIEERDWNEE